MVKIPIVILTFYEGVKCMVLYIYIYNNTPVWERECSIHDPNPNEYNNDLYE